ncbi:MAG: exodeoxyribonuclease V subunit beta [Desulfomonilia bacterium]
MNSTHLLNISLEGIHLIEASAGTGKTYTLTSLYLRYLLEHELSVDQILVVTYTVPATDELRERIRARIRCAIDAFSESSCDDEFICCLKGSGKDLSRSAMLLTDALHRFDEAAIFTIHGFCQRMLNDMAFESGSPFTSELITDQSEILLQVIDDFFRQHVLKQSNPEFIRYARNKGVTPEGLLALVRRVPLHASITPDGEKPDIEAACSRYRHTFEQVQQCWNSDREEILNLLSSNSGLKRSIYKQSSIATWGSQMDEFISSRGRTLPLFPHFDRFTTSKIRSSLKMGFSAPEHRFFSLGDELMERAHEFVAAMDDGITWLKRELFRFVDAELPGRKEKNGLIHFDDLLLKMRNALRSESGGHLARAVRKQVKAALIDEFQDTDPIQYEIFRALFPSGPLFLIGDPKQAIYSFRGADIFTYLEASRAIPAGNSHTLTENYRSDPGLIRATNTLFSSCRGPFIFQEIGFEPVTPALKEDREILRDGENSPFTVWFFRSGSERPMSKSDGEGIVTEAMVCEISRLLNKGHLGQLRIGQCPLKPRNIAILVRENRQARMIRDILRTHEIPCVILSDENIFDSPESLDMELVLKAISQPFSEGLIRTALATPILGFTAHDIDALMENEHIWEQWIIRFRTCHEVWRSRGFISMFRRFISEVGLRERILSQHRGERILTNILHLSEVLNQAERDRKLGMHQLLKWLSQQRDPSMLRQDEHQLRLETDEDAVKVLTVHKSKGLEFPVVFCPFSWAGTTLRDGEHMLFHDPTHHWAPTFDLSSAAHDAHRRYAWEEALAENMRLLYVAVTRAKHRCYLVWGRFNQAETSSLAHLLHSGHLRHDSEGGRVLTAALEDEAVMIRDLEAVADDAGKDVSLEEPPRGKPEKYIGQSLPSGPVTPRTFRGTIDRSWGIASFTSLVTGSTSPLEEVADRDALSPIAPSFPAGSPEQILDMFSLPRGARTGRLLHRIFELLDYQADEDTIMSCITRVMEEFGFDEKWDSVIFTMVKKVLRVRFGDVSLSEISSDSRVAELEFYVPLKKTTPNTLFDIFRRFDMHYPAFPEMMRSLSFDPVQGYLRGFIDLVFSSNGRFFIVDWKSNFLGDTVEDYTGECLQEVMRKDYYILQYHLYTLALDQHLRRTVRSYSYREHVAGVYYVFLRGIDPDSGSEYGLYSVRPEEEVISSLRERLVADPVKTREGNLFR